MSAAALNLQIPRDTSLIEKGEDTDTGSNLTAPGSSNWLVHLRLIKR